MVKEYSTIRSNRQTLIHITGFTVTTSTNTVVEHINNLDSKNLTIKHLITVKILTIRHHLTITTNLLISKSYKVILKTSIIVDSIIEHSCKTFTAIKNKFLNGRVNTIVKDTSDDTVETIKCQNRIRFIITNGFENIKNTSTTRNCLTSLFIL